MRQNKLHDALGLLDDDLIEAVEKLRSGAPKKRVSMYWISAAACLCIAAVVLFAAEKFVQPLLDRQSADGLKYGGYDNVASVESGNTDESGEAVFSLSLLLKITSWRENGFTGTVAGILDTESYTVGTELTVLFSEDVFYYPGEESSAKEGAPTSKDFPVGTTVWVQFHGVSENAPEAGTEESILVAKSIGPASLASAPADTTE